MLRDPPPPFLCPISPPRLSPPALTARLFSMAAAAAAADVGPGLRVSEDRILWLVRSHWVETRRTDRFHHALIHITSAATLNFCSGASAACPWPLNWSTPLWILIQRNHGRCPLLSSTAADPYCLRCGGVVHDAKPMRLYCACSHSHTVDRGRS